jgi:hypothetical protein
MTSPLVNGAGQSGIESGAELGPAISIALTESGTFARWLLRVDVTLPGGRFCLGHVFTTPPTEFTPATTPGLRSPSARIVALAICPGAIGWSIWAEAFVLNGTARDHTAQADIALASAHPGEGDSIGSMGVYPINSFGVGRAVPRIRTAQIVSGAAAAMWAPEEPFRVRALLRNSNPAVGPLSVFIGGSAAVTVATGLEVPPGEEFEAIHGRPLFVISTGPQTVSTYIEEG